MGADTLEATLRSRFQAVMVPAHPTYRLGYWNHTFAPNGDLAFVIFGVDHTPNPQTVHAGGYTHRHLVQITASIYVKKTQGVGLHAEIRDTISTGWIEWQKPAGYHFFPTSLPIEVGEDEVFGGYHRQDAVTRIEYDEQGVAYPSSPTEISDLFSGSFASGQAVQFNAGGAWELAEADDETKSALGVVASQHGSEFRLVYLGRVPLPSHGLGAVGTKLYLSETAGELTSVPPSAPSFIQEVAVVDSDDSILVIQRSPIPQ
jgi:hypothetical protein